MCITHTVKINSHTAAPYHSGSESVRLNLPFGEQYTTHKHTETYGGKQCIYTRSCKKIIINHTQIHYHWAIAKAHSYFTSVPVSKHDLLCSCNAYLKKKKQQTKASIPTHILFSSWPTPKRTSAEHICIKMIRRCYCAFIVMCQRLLCWAGYSEGFSGQLGDGNQIMNTFYIRTHLIFSAAQGEILSGSQQWFPLSCKRHRTWKCQSAKHAQIR